MRNIFSNKLSVFIVTLALLFVGIEDAWGNETKVVGVTLPSDNTYTVKLNVQRDNWDTDGGWTTPTMTRAGLTFEGKQLYLTSYETSNGWIKVFQYQTYDGETQKYSKEMWNWNSDGNNKANHFNKWVWDWDGGSTCTQYKTGSDDSQYSYGTSKLYFDATGWSETNIRVVVGYASMQKYRDMTVVSGTKLYYNNNLDSWTDAMGFGIVGGETGDPGDNTRIGDGREYGKWLTDISAHAIEYTGLRHYGINNNGNDVCYLVVNAGKQGEMPTVTYNSDYLTYLNSTQTFYSVVKEAGGSYTSANSKATISISSYELTGQGSTTNRTPELATNESSETVTACRTANTRLQVGDVAAGYQFDGWWTDATGGTRESNSTDYTYNPIAATTLYARFSAKNYNITLDKENGESNGSVTLTYNSASHAAITNPTKSSYTFIGWYTGDNGTGSMVIDPNGTLQENVSDYTGAGGVWVRDEASTTLYAKWLENCYAFTPSATSGDIAQGDEITTSTGGKMVATVREGLAYSSNGIWFSNGSDKVTVTLNNRMQAGSVITLSMIAGGSTGTRGFILKTASGGSVTDGTLTFDASAATNNTLAYTVVADDGLEGEYEFQIIRTGGNMNLKGLTVSNCGDAVYAVTNTLTNVTKTSGDSKAGGEDYAAVYAPSSGYVLPATIAVTIGGSEATVDDDYTWDPTTGTLTINEVSITDEVSVTISGVAVNYSFVNTTTSGSLAVDDTPATSSGGTMTVVGVGSATSLAYNSAGLYFTNGGDSVKVTISGKNMQAGSLIYVTLHGNTGNRGLTLRDAGGTEITSAPFKWNNTSGGYETKTFLYEVAEDDGLEGTNVFKLQRYQNTYLKSIYVANCADRYGVTHTLTNVSKTSGGDYAGGKDYTAVYSVGTGYTMPETITVTIGGDTKTVDTDYTWDDETGTVTIPKANLTGAVVITVATDPNEYTITYKDQGDISYQGSNSESLLTTHTYDSETDLVDGVRSGYDFLGWYENSTCTGSPVTTLGATDYTDDITLYAKWGKTINQNNFYQLYSTSDVTDADALIAAAGFPEYITTTFDKKYWWGNGQFATCSIDVPHDYTGMTSGGNRAYLYFNSSTKTVTLRAVKNVKAVRFYGWNNGTGLNISTTATLARGSGSMPTFSNVAISGTNALVAEHIIYISTTDGSTARTNYSDEAYYDLTFTFGGGSWLGMYVETNDVLTLTYSANGGSGAPAAEDWAPNETKHLSSTAPTRSNYLFAGWNTESDGSGDSYAAGGVYTMPLEAKTLYAQWVQPVSQNNFYQLYGNEKTSAAALIAAAGFPSYITTTFSGYSAWGGYTTPTIDVPYDFTTMSGYYDFLIADDYETITLHNVANIKAVHFYGWDQWSDHNIVTSVTKKNVTSSAPSIANVPVTAENGVVRHYVVHVSTTDGSTARANYSANDVYDLTFTFQQSTWVGMYVETNDRVTLTYDANGGEDAPDAESWAPNATDHLASTEPTRAGYSFAGWNEEADGSGETTYDAEAVYTMPLTNKILYAQWTPVTLNFTGGASGTGIYWNDADNWSPACVPTSAHDVIIPKYCEVGKYGAPVVATAKSIVIDTVGHSSARLLVNAGYALAVEEMIKVKTSAGETYGPTTERLLQLESNSSYQHGALAVKGYNDEQIDIVARVKFHTQSCVHNFASLGGEYAGYYVNQFIGTPLRNPDLWDYYGCWIYMWDPTHHNEFDDTYGDWVYQTSSTPLKTFQGYDIMSEIEYPETYWLEGQLVYAQDTTLDLSYNAKHVTDMGAELGQENMFANSWTAPIDVSQMTTSDFAGGDASKMEATIYIFNSGWPNAWAELKEKIGTDPGQYLSMGVKSGAYTSGITCIPAMQAFSVFAKTTGASLTLDYDRIVYNPLLERSTAIEPMRAPRRERTEQTSDDPQIMRIRVEGTQGADQIHLLLREDFNAGFDNGWDARKMFGESYAPQLYSITDDGNMAVNCIQEAEGTVLGFRKGSEDSVYTFRFEYDGIETLYLNDLATETSTLIDAETTYTFTATENDTEARFVISASPINNAPTGVDHIGNGASNVHKLMINGVLYIIRGGRIYNVNGAVVK